MRATVRLAARVAATLTFKMMSLEVISPVYLKRTPVWNLELIGWIFHTLVVLVLQLWWVRAADSAVFLARLRRPSGFSLGRILRLLLLLLKYHLGVSRQGYIDR